MKILKLKFRNLNSLRGEWEIDFTTKDYESDGIFAIVGPTGAGKSTILDAICLALYGETPRLGRITTENNEVMSRCTSDCSAEVRFVAQGGTYICNWRQHRSRRESGKLQAAHHEIANAEDGKIIESHLSQTRRKVEAITGMDFGRFTRSMLLAQGSFDTFLKANPDERSPILEQITGTEIYSEISKAVHERLGEERNLLEKIDAEISGIGLLSVEEENQNRELLIAQRAKSKETEEEFKSTGKALQWLKKVHECRSEIEKENEEATKIARLLENFIPERQKLIAAQKAAELDGPFTDLSNKRKQQSADQERLNSAQKEMPVLVRDVEQSEEDLKKAFHQLEQAKKKQKDDSQLIRKVRNLDAQLADKKQLIDTENKKLSEKQNEIDETTSKIKNETHKLEKDQKERIPLQQYQKEHAEDKKLCVQFEAIKVNFTTLQNTADDLTDHRKLEIKASKVLQDTNNTLEQARVAVEDALKKHKNIFEKIVQKEQECSDLLKGKTIEELRSRKDELQTRVFCFKKIENLKEERKHLEDGKPCPLCGAEQHPYAMGNIPQIGETEKQLDKLGALIKDVEKLEKQINTLKDSEKELSKKLTQTEADLNIALQAKNTAEEDLNKKREEVSKVSKRFDSLKLNLLQELNSFGIKEINEKKPSSLVGDLKTRLDKWNDNDERLLKIGEEITRFENNISSFKEALKIHQDALSKNKSQVRDYDNKYNELWKERTNLFGTKDADSEEKRLEEKVIEADQLWNKARNSNVFFKSQQKEKQGFIESLEQNIARRVPEIKNSESQFLDALSGAGFESEELFLRQRLERQEREALKKRAFELDTQQTQVESRKKKAQEQLESELQNKITSEPEEELQKRYAVLDEEWKRIQKEIGAIEQKIKANEEAGEKIKEKKTLKEKQDQVCEKWRKLHALIGSADGKKFRNFAQGITFERMVAHANQQLTKMSDRYILDQNKEEPLELNVIDSWQGGEIRSVKNLSGGESFIVSLSLALGLSRMSSRKVRVDSLFLDEGFGTLDSEALEMALGALAELRNDDKLIGVISHVNALKERISLKINVQRADGGCSIIEGPGCACLSRR